MTLLMYVIPQTHLRTINLYRNSQKWTTIQHQTPFRRFWGSAGRTAGRYWHQLSGESHYYSSNNAAPTVRDRLWFPHVWHISTVRSCTPIWRKVSEPVAEKRNISRTISRPPEKNPHCAGHLGVHCGRHKLLEGIWAGRGRVSSIEHCHTIEIQQQEEQYWINHTTLLCLHCKAHPTKRTVRLSFNDYQ